MNSEELTHKAEEEIAALISKRLPNYGRNRARGFRIEFAPRETMKGLEGYHVKLTTLAFN
ncbi:hypothetical protein SEEC0006_07454 [Salmonella enterica subsp. enterica serovar Choleraesuis str. 0006]|nr:hypothetical protein SEEC0006_07454 [Salmonella enterica subsp. enterica serovar Choleraesuis str. 0006]